MICDTAALLSQGYTGMRGPPGYCSHVVRTHTSHSPLSASHPPSSLLPPYPLTLRISYLLPSFPPSLLPSLPPFPPPSFLPPYPLTLCISYLLSSLPPSLSPSLPPSLFLPSLPPSLPSFPPLQTCLRFLQDSTVHIQPFSAAMDTDTPVRSQHSMFYGVFTKSIKIVFFQLKICVIFLMISSTWCNLSMVQYIQNLDSVIFFLHKMYVCGATLCYSSVFVK